MGLGAMRTRTDMRRLGYPGALRRPLLGRDQGRARPGGRDRSRRGAALRPEPAQRGTSPSTRRRTWRASASGATELGIRSVLVHALYLCNLATPDEVIYGKSVETMRSTVDAACAIEADGVVFHVGSHLGSGFEAGLERCVPALREVLERCSDTTWLLLENSAGAGGTIGRSIDELAAIVDALDRHERLGVCLDSCHLYVSGVDVGEPEAGDGDAEGGRRADRARPAARAARQRRGRTARLEPRPARERARGRARRAARRVPRAHSRFRGCPR